MGHRHAALITGHILQSHSHGSNVNHEENGQYAASWVDVASELAVKGDQYVAPPVDINERGLAVSGSRDNAGGAERPNVGDTSEECQGSVMPKVGSLLLFLQQISCLNFLERIVIWYGRTNQPAQCARQDTSRNDS